LGNILLPTFIVLVSFVAAIHAGYVPMVQATTSTSWNPRVQCTPLIVRVTDITANKTGSGSFSASPFSPGITTSVAGGSAKRWLTPGPTPPGWVSPGPNCANSNGKSLFVEIDGIERDSISTEDSASSYDPTNGGTSHATTYDHTFNVFDPAVVPNFSTSCTSASDPTCYGRIHSEIDHDWLAAGYCGTSTACDPSALASQTSYASTKIDIQGFVYWDPSHLSAGYHNYNGWEIHPLTAWRLSGQKDFSISTTPSSVSFAAGSTGTFSAIVSGQNGFTGTVSLTTSASPSGLSVSCNPTSISGGSGSSTCTMNSPSPGSYSVTITGTSGSLSHSSSVSVTVATQSTPDFSMSANPTSLTIAQGSSATSTISLVSLDGFSGTISLSALVSPSGPLASLSPSTVTLSSNGVGSSTLNINTNNASVGSYIVNVTGTSGSLSHSVKVNVSVNGPADFAISANPNSLTLGQGSSNTLTPMTITTSGDRTWFESSYLSDSFYAQGHIWIFFEDSSQTCEGIAGCLLYTTSSTGSSWATPINLNVHVTDSDFSVYTDGTNVYYVRYDELTFESTCGRNMYFRTGTLVGSSGTVNWQAEQIALKGLSTNTYPNDEIIVDSTGQAWIAFLSDSHSACGGNGTDLPQIIHSASTNFASWTTPITLSTAHSNNWHIALVSLGSGEIYASYWLRGSDLHGRLFNGTSWTPNLNLPDEQISSATTQNDVNAWLFNSGTNVYAIYFDNGPETFNFASRSSTGTWTTNVIGVGESRTGTTFSSSYYSFPDAASYDPAHNQFYLFWMNATLQRIDEWKGAGSSWTKTTKIVGTTAVPYPDSITSFITSSPTNSFPTTGGIFYISGSSAPFTYNFVALPLSGSSTGTFTVTITSQNGFTGTINLSTSISPSTGLTVNCNPTTITGGSGSSTCTVTGSTAGNYNVTVTGTSGSLSHSTSVSVSVQTSSPDFAVSSSPTSVTVITGASGTSAVTVAPLNGFTGTVTLSVTTNSTSLVCTLSSASITGGSGTSTLSCHGSPAANYLATVIGTSGSLSHSATVTYHVQDFSVSASPASVSVTTGASGTSTIAVSPLNGFSGTVTLAVITNSTNLSCILSSASISGASGTSTLSCSSNVPGNYLAIVTGTSGTLSHSANVVFHATNAPDFTLSANPTIVTVNSGDAGNSTVTVAPLNGFSGAVTLVVTTNSTKLSCTLSSTSINGGSGTSTLSCRGSPAGNYLATVTGSSGSLSHSTTVRYQEQDFTVAANPTSVNDSVGVAGNSTITVAPLNGFAGTVLLAATTNSANLVCALSRNSISNGSGTSTLSCTASLPGSYVATVTGTNSGLSHAANVTYNVTIPVQDFTISANPTTATVNVGVPGNSTITVSPENGFVGTVTLTVAANATDIACALSPTTITGGSGSSVLSCSGSTAGNYLANVTGTSGTLSHSATVTYHVQDFAITANPVGVSTSVGVAGSSTISVAAINGFSGTVNLAATTNSTSLSCTLSSTAVPGGSGTSLLRCTGSIVGNYSANVTGTSGTLTHSTSVAFKVIATPDFGLTANPTSVSDTTGSPGLSTITVASMNGFTGTVTLSVITTSPSLSCTLSSTTISGGSGTSNMSCISNAAGSYVANVTGASGGLSHSAIVTYQITSAPDFTLSASPTSLTIAQGASGTSAITLTSLNGFSGTVTLSASSSPLGPSTNLNPGTVTLSSNGVGSSTLNVTSASASPGAYKINVTATSGSLSHSFLLNMTITGTNVSPAYALVVSYEGFVYKLYPNNTLTLIGQPVTTQLSAVAWKPDGSCAVIVGNAAVLIKWDGTTLTSIPTGFSTTINLISVAWRPDGSYALIGGSGGALLKYDCSSVTQISNPYAVSYRAVSWNPSGTQALLVTYFGKIYQYQSSTSQVTQLTSPTSQSLDAVAWNPNGSYALLAGSGGAILRYDGTTFQLLNTAGIYSSSLTVRYISFNPTGSMALLVGDSGLVLTYDGSSLTALPTLTSSILYYVSWSAGTAYIVGGSGVMLTYSSGTLKSVPTGTFSGFRGIAWKPN